MRIVSSKQVFPPRDEEEGETLHNLRIEVGRNPQPCLNREMHSPQGSDWPSIPEAGEKPGSFGTQLDNSWQQVDMASAEEKKFSIINKHFETLIKITAYIHIHVSINNKLLIINKHLETLIKITQNLYQVTISQKNMTLQISWLE